MHKKGLKFAPVVELAKLNVTYITKLANASPPLGMSSEYMCLSARPGFSLVNLGSLIRPLALGMASYFGLLSHSHRAYIFGYGCRTYF